MAKPFRFRSKIISIDIKANDSSIDLTDPVFEKIGGRLFVSGVVPKECTESGWLDGIEFKVAWDQVVDFACFKSVRQYKTAVKKSHKYDAKKK